MRPSKEGLSVWKCEGCGLEQDINLFKHYTRTNGLKSISSFCEDCRSKRRKEYDLRRRGPGEKSKECVTCNEVKALSLFKFGIKYSDGYSEQCRDCTRSQILEFIYISEGKDKKRAVTSKLNFIKIHYGLSGEEYIALMKNSTNCEICKVPLSNKEKCIDHNHKTGKVRGVICSKCNSALGKIYENKDSLLRAISYLNKHNSLVSSSNGASND